MSSSIQAGMRPQVTRHKTRWCRPRIRQVYQYRRHSATLPSAWRQSGLRQSAALLNSKREYMRSPAAIRRRPQAWSRRQYIRRLTRR